MGEEARWVCHTCKTICSRGGRPIIIRTKKFVMADWEHIRETVSRLESLMIGLDTADREMPDLFVRWDGFMSDLKKWLSRHEGHNIHIGSDYTTDSMDLDNYHNETVDNKVSRYTQLEYGVKGTDEWVVNKKRDIKDILDEHASSDDTVEELYYLMIEGL